MNHDDFLVPPGQQIRLADYDPACTGTFTSEQEAQASMNADIASLAHSQNILHAHATYGLLVLFQGMDGAGKDETIAYLMSGVEPQACAVKRFESPTDEELRHDYLWRAVQALPAQGQLGIFNRSYYEQVTTEQVYWEQLDQQYPPPETQGADIWHTRCDHINNFEHYLIENRTIIVKFFLNVSKEQERERLLARIQQPEEQWDFSADDLNNHRHWEAFMTAYEDVINRTSTPWAPWYIIPADNWWFTYAAVTSIMVAKLKSLHTSYPPLSAEQQQLLVHAQATLEQERQSPQK